MKRPNVLFIHTDQQRWDTIKANGNNIIKTPNLDRLVKHGINFDHCFAQSPVCMPSRISSMTGQYCSSLKITKMAITVPEDAPTIQKILRLNGYYTALIGKLHYLPHSNRDHRELHPDYYFNHLELSDEPGCYEDAYRAWVKSKAPQELENISLGLPPAAHHWINAIGFTDNINHPHRATYEVSHFKGNSNITHSAFVGEQTLEFLENNQSQPFFCFSSFYSPHEPWIIPKEFFDLYENSEIEVPFFPESINQERFEGAFSDDKIKAAIKGYYAAISEVDSWIGKILDKLDNLGLTENTVIVFYSDHGEFLGEHLKYGKGYFAPDVISRVPLILSVPENLNGIAGSKYSGIVECVDIVPTILDLCGIQIPPQVNGNVLPVKNSSNPYSGDGLGLTEYYGWKSLRTNRFRYVVNDSGKELLFDIEKDSKEYFDLTENPDYKESLNYCRKSLLVKLIRIEATLKHEWAY
ncbi:MAG: sulfatase family protein [Saccharofermentanales bacterium]